MCLYVTRSLLFAVLYFTAIIYSSLDTPCPQESEAKFTTESRTKFDYDASLAFLSQQFSTALFSPITFDVNLHILMFCGELGHEYISPAKTVLSDLKKSFKSRNEKFNTASNVYYLSNITETISTWDPLFLKEGYNIEDSGSVFDKHREWVIKKSNGRINTPLTEENFRKGERIYCSIVYFKDFWAKKFDPENTRDDSFTLRNGERITRKFLNNNDHYKYEAANFNGLKFQVLAIPYEEQSEEGCYKRYIFYLIPSDNNVDSKDLWTAFFLYCDQDISSQLVKMKSEDIFLSIPKIEALESTLDLSGIITNLIRSKPATLVTANMKTYLQIDEEGTEAIGFAYTVLTSSPYSKITYVRADVPYIAFIYDVSIDRILFILKDEGETY